MVWLVAAWLVAYPSAGSNHYRDLLGRTIAAAWLIAGMANTSMVYAFAAKAPFLFTTAHFVAAFVAMGLAFTAHILTGLLAAKYITTTKRILFRPHIVSTLTLTRLLVLFSLTSGSVS